mmetsp:Transcript_30056/g.75285  ORF Transcript_30056/g.75285 Transcript_30056/m.75285 type:complete len:225 (+) Transcript_30056:3666-4340(+)
MSLASRAASSRRRSTSGPAHSCSSPNRESRNRSSASARAANRRPRKTSGGRGGWWEAAGEVLPAPQLPCKASSPAAAWRSTAAVRACDSSCPSHEDQRDGSEGKCPAPTDPTSTRRSAAKPRPVSAWGGRDPRPGLPLATPAPAPAVFTEVVARRSWRRVDTCVRNSGSRSANGTVLRLRSASRVEAGRNSVWALMRLPPQWAPFAPRFALASPQPPPNSRDIV